MIGLLRESGWSAGGHRLYDEEVFSRLDWIVEMKRLKKTIPEISELLEKSA
jgi:DNA-binding transcriptional MerR regulator